MRKTIVIQNETRYRTADLRGLVLRCMNYLGLKGPKHVRLSYSKRSTHWGYAWLDVDLPHGTHREGKHVVLTAPPADRLSIGRFASLVEHELLHTKGLRHKDMNRHQRYGAHDDAVPEWAKGLHLREKVPQAPIPVADRIAGREAHVKKMLARAERRLKLAATIVKKWRGKARYYDRRRAAAEPLAASPPNQTPKEAP
jgi:hypothetical protein